MLLVNFDRNAEGTNFLSQLFPVQEGKRVSEIRMTRALLHFLIADDRASACFDPVARVQDLHAGYAGTLFGATVSVLPYLEHARLQDWPEDACFIFHK